jgi:hypothetical protein
MEPPALYPRQAAIALIGQAVHFIVHLDRAPGGARVLSSVREVLGDDGDQIISNEILAPGPDGRAVPATRLRDDTLDMLLAAGLDPAVLDDPRWWGP